MEKTVITFNDLPEVVAQLRDEVMSLRSLLTEQRSVNNAKLYRDELDRWLESSRKNPVPLSDEELSESMSSSHRRKPGQRNW